MKREIWLEVRVIIQVRVTYQTGMIRLFTRLAVARRDRKRNASSISP